MIAKMKSFTILKLLLYLDLDEPCNHNRTITYKIKKVED